MYVVTVSLRHGYPVLTVPLPSKRESCDFALRPFLHNVDNFANYIKAEDGGIDRCVRACVCADVCLCVNDVWSGVFAVYNRLLLLWQLQSLTHKGHIVAYE